MDVIEMKTAYLIITTWVGPVAWYAMHYYGNIHFGSAPWLDVKFTLNQSDVKKFNKLEREKGDLGFPDSGYKIGSRSGRFLKQDRLIKEAIKLFKKDSHGYDALLSGNDCVCDPLEMLTGPEGCVKEANSLWRQFEDYKGWGCQKEEKPEVQKICDDWDDIVGKQWERG